MQTKQFLPHYKIKQNPLKYNLKPNEKQLPKLISKINLNDISQIQMEASFEKENRKIEMKKIKKHPLFKKNINKIQTNINLLEEKKRENAISAKTCSSSFYKSKNTMSSFHEESLIQNIKRSRESVKQMNISFYPKTFEEITNKYQNKYCDKSYKIYNRYFGLQGYQNKKLKKIPKKQNFALPKFNICELQSYYKSILIYAQNDFQKFKYSFQIMLSLCNITVRENILNQCLSDLKKDISFKKFIKVFIQIQERVRKQAIIDYFQILLEENKKKQITYEQLVSTFKTRMKKEIANELTVLIFQTLNRDFCDVISKQKIYQLCYQNQTFCNQFHILNRRNAFNQKRIP